MKLNELSPAEGSTHRRMRVGRGTSSGKGRTCGRGTKGQKARGNVPPYFEGGQTPLHRRLPKKRGFTNKWRVEYGVVNLSSLEKAFEAGTTVDPEALVQSGLVREGVPVKVLGNGDIAKALTVKAHAFSATAKEKISAAGGAAEVL
jgi:large subunit ribosomal protein L15